LSGIKTSAQILIKITIESNSGPPEFTTTLDSLAYLVGTKNSYTLPSVTDPDND